MAGSDPSGMQRTRFVNSLDKGPSKLEPENECRRFVAVNCDLDTRLFGAVAGDRPFEGGGVWS